MSRTARPIPILVRAGVAAAAAAVLLTACGGDDGGTATGPAESTGAAAGDADSGFCSQAAGIDQRVDAALSDREGDDSSLPDAFRQIAVELRDIDAPAAIASDWAAMAAGLDRMADAFSDVDITDLDSLESLEAAEGGLTAASENVDAYLGDECGL
jgi:hypothetical protein